jgi:hypothetical protein
MPPVRYRHGCKYSNLACFLYRFFLENTTNIFEREVCCPDGCSLSSGGGFCVVVCTLRVDIRIVKIKILGILSRIPC